MATSNIKLLTKLAEFKTLSLRSSVALPGTQDLS
jgi:hypothetical protein